MLIDEVNAVSDSHCAVGGKFAEPSTRSYIAVTFTYFLSIAMSKEYCIGQMQEEK